MLVNPDFSRRALLAPDQYRWVASPQGGVERVMLDRLGGEQARATSLVRYARGSMFPEHTHPEGEEILVLAGTFSECGHAYPAGWYLRSPPGSSHCPSSENGATLFVKLRQMPCSERRFVRIDTRDPSQWRRRDGREVCPLFEDDVETVRIERLAANQRLSTYPRDGGAEILMLDGTLHDDAQHYPRGSWLRLPSGDVPDFVAGSDGATLYLKTGHLIADTTKASRSC